MEDTKISIIQRRVKENRIISDAVAKGTNKNIIKKTSIMKAHNSKNVHRSYTLH